MAARILVAGIGNIFLGDDGFGPEVLRHVGGKAADPGVHITDYGIRGLHLAYDLLEDWDALVLIDAVPDRGSPGTVHVFQSDHETLSTTAGFDAHSMDPGAVFATLRSLGGVAPPTVVVGCEVADVSDGIGLSEPVAAAVPEAVRAVESVLAMLRSEVDATVRKAD
jgi:hydrogenase maturation protease